MSNVTALRKTAVTAPVWLSPEQVCQRVPGMTVANLKELRKRGRGPRFHKPTVKTVIYEASDIDAWVLKSRVPTTEQP